jgi:hypothetical protein
LFLTLSGTVARLAFVIHRDTPGIREERLGRILTFFGVPWEPRSLTDLMNAVRPPDGGRPYAVLGSAETIGAAMATPQAAAVLHGAAALYAYATEDRETSMRTLSTLAGAEWTWRPAPGSQVSVEITDRCPELTGPMSGVRATTQLTGEDGTLSPSENAAGLTFVPIVSVDGAPACVRLIHGGVPAYFCASTAIVDIDAPVRRNYYDIKDHFLSAVPLVMFITWAFREVMWRPHELGACLIIDDPLLKRRYGFCDFPRLRDLMREHRFTTNVAFIPWNWRRTTRRASEFFRRESDLFSVSVHGCDHVAAEFGATSLDVIDGRARLAQTRMRKHQARTKIQHDPVMVFPQGVFSSTCPGVLKRNGFVAAVNTEISPVDRAGAETLVRDVWDVAILRYGSFPIYTRRYQHHGLENFAFDLLLGKPCFIVAHHEFFRDGGTALVRLVDQLRALNCTLHWRSPREVIRRAYRTRDDDSVRRVQMYGTEALLTSSDDRIADFHVDKREHDVSVIADVANDGRNIKWSHTSDGLTFECVVPAREQVRVQIRYQDNSVARRAPVSVRYELSVAARRILSELRDEYVQKFRSSAKRSDLTHQTHQPDQTHVCAE